MVDRKAKFKHKKLPVHFGSLNIGDETASIGISLAPEDLLSQAEITGDKEADADAAVIWARRNLMQRQLKGKITLGRREESETQGKVIETDYVVEGTFDTSKISVTRKVIGLKLAVTKSAIDIGTLSRFATQSGFFLVTSLMNEIDVDKMEAERAAENDSKRELLNGENDEAGNPDAPPAVKPPKREKAKAK